jgi:magnesium and cobalt transporter
VSKEDDPEPQSNSLLTKLKNTLQKKLIWSLHRQKGKKAFDETLEELIDKVSETSKDENAKLLANALRLRKLKTQDIMVPRADIEAVSDATSLKDLIPIFIEKGYSRFPIYHETLDNILGMIHIKDVFAQWQNQEAFQLRRIVRKVLFTSPSMRLQDLLLEMRQTRTHMALVVDEFGGIDGLITIEDVVEEIVGEIQDEHESEELPLIIDHHDGSLLADGRLPIEDFQDKTGILLSLKSSDIDTIGGFVVSLAGHMPSKGENIQDKSGCKFKIIEADPRRIKRLKITLPKGKKQKQETRTKDAPSQKTQS